MTTHRTTYERVVLSCTHKWIDPETGKKRQHTVRFEQTINPYNVGIDGEMKTRGQIMRELEAKARSWLIKRENDIRDLQK